MEAVRRQLAATRGTRKWPIHAAIGWPADSIVEAARQWRSSLIVVGLGHHGALDRLIGSETAVSISRKAGVPLLAVPEDIRRLPTHAVAAIDFTPSSERAARLAAHVVRAEGVVTLLHASMLAEPASPGSLSDVYVAGAQDKLDALARDIAAESGRRTRAILIDAPAAEAALSAIEQDHCDLIALGSHTRGIIDRLISGSVRTRVLRAAACPVLIAPE
jgi:nucleotide-binding universal stress UspA family protein